MPNKLYAYKNQRDFNRVRDVVRRVEDAGRKTYQEGSKRLLQGENGTSSTSSSQIAIPAKITSGIALTGYAVTLYADGVDEAPTDNGTAYALDMAIADNVAAGSYAIVFNLASEVTGGE